MIYYSTDITYGIYATYFLMGVVSVLLIELVAMAIAVPIMKRKTRKLQENLIADPNKEKTNHE